ncbi:hypothetical protein [Fusibacter sp. JL216-2]|uniref:hypothetical protein n=1 Tax=Fusibacter sp. JL216-2 TaxID=3071453 RepID=UPI003D3306FA
MGRKTIYENPAISIMEADKHGKAYIYSHDTYSNGRRVLILPYRKHIGGHEFLLRREIIPCWDEAADTCAVSTRVKNNDVEQTIIDELEELTGYDIKAKELIHLGLCMGSKTTDTVYELYTVNLSDRGSEELPYHIENGEHSFWGKDDDVLKSIDAHLITCFTRLTHLIGI